MPRAHRSCSSTQVIGSNLSMIRVSSRIFCLSHRGRIIGPQCSSYSTGRQPIPLTRSRSGPPSRPQAGALRSSDSVNVRTEMGVGNRDITFISHNPTATSDVIFGAKKWEQLGILDSVVTALSELQFARPTLIQEMALGRLAQTSRSAVIADQTGTGKTLAYLIPIVDALKRDEQAHGPNQEFSRPKAIVICPSRELAEQIGRVAKSLCRIVKLRVVVMVGGHKFKPEKEALQKQPVDILITTPGRLLNHREKERVYISRVTHVAVDEADTMFAKDFKDDLMKVIGPIARRMDDVERPSRFFFAAATLSKLLLDEIDSAFPNCERIVTPSVHKVVGTIRQEFVRCEADKTDILLSLLRQFPSNAKTMIFCNTIDSCRWLDKFLQERNYECALIHGSVPPRDRRAAFNRFTSGEVPILICTDLAARGLDTTDVNHVVLFDFPTTVVDYIHRVGRTARAGRFGVVYSLVRKRDVPLAEAIQESIRNGTPLDGVASPSSAPGQL